MKKALPKLDKISSASFGSKSKTTHGKDNHSFVTEWFVNLGKERENVEKEFKEKEKLDEKMSALTIKVIDDYKKLAEGQQNSFLQEREKRLKLEEELRGWGQLYSWVEEGRNKYSKESKGFENKFWQLRIILSYYGFKQKDIDKIVDGNISPLEWEKKPEIQRKQKEITDKRFKCEGCDECNKESIN